jgi:2-C-methyl-D-erythritol 4-phosphate cytidylyltransferase
MGASAIIVAGGSGARFGTKKQFINLGGVPILRRTALCFDSHPFIEHIVIVVPAEDIEHVTQILVGLPTPLDVTAGGATRQESVYNGLQVATSADVVLIHDGVRPLVSLSLISRVLAGIGDLDACIPGIAVADTLKEAQGQVVVKTIPRDNVYQIQTPQAFKRAGILEAHTSARNHNIGNFTDDSALIENAGGKVGLVSGDPFNIKITLKEDIYIAEAILRCHTESD